MKHQNAYLVLVRSKLEYVSIVWDPYLKCDIDRLERVQRSAARFITRDYKSREEGCFTKMLTDLGLSSLEERRRQQRLTLPRWVGRQDSVGPAPPFFGFCGPQTGVWWTKMEGEEFTDDMKIDFEPNKR